MFRSSRASASPRRLLIVAAAALIPVLAGCEAGNDAPTLHWHYPTVGAGTIVNGISIRNMFILGSKQALALPAGHNASLFFALVNDGSPDRLLSVRAPGSAKAVTLPGGSIRLGASQAVLLTGPRPSAILTGLTRSIETGSSLPLVLTFQRAGTVRLDVPVLAGQPSYATFSAPPVPTPTPTGHHRSASPSPSVSSLTPSPSATSTP